MDKAVVSHLPAPLYSTLDQRWTETSIKTLISCHYIKQGPGGVFVGAGSRGLVVYLWCLVIFVSLGREAPGVSSTAWGTRAPNAAQSVAERVEWIKAANGGSLRLRLVTRHSSRVSSQDGVRRWCGSAGWPDARYIAGPTRGTAGSWSKLGLPHPRSNLEAKWRKPWKLCRNHHRELSPNRCRNYQSFLLMNFTLVQMEVNAYNDDLVLGG